MAGGASYEKPNQRWSTDIDMMKKELSDINGEISDAKNELADLKKELANAQSSISSIIGSVDNINSNSFQPRGELNADPSTLKWNQTGTYRVHSKNPVNGIGDGFLIHFSPFGFDGVWIQIVSNYSAGTIYIRGSWYGTIRDWVKIK